MPSLQFKGKQFVQNHHLTLNYHPLIPCSAASVTPEISLDDNLIIHGDNLIALKALLPTYADRIKLIYIDPPYNTGNEGWMYNDNVNSPMMQEWLKANKPIDDQDLTRHDKWLCMMMPRLKLLRELLRDDGVMFISIDDHEVHHLRMLMNEIFGDGNFIAQLVWEKGRKNDAKLFSIAHDYIVVYAKSLATLRSLHTIWREPKPGANEIWTEYCQLRQQYGDDDRAIAQALQRWYRTLDKQHPAKKLSRYKHVDQHGPWRDRDISWPTPGGPCYEVIHPHTKQPCAVPANGWRFATPEAMQRQIDMKLVEFRADHTQPPFRKAHLRPVSAALHEDVASRSDGDRAEEDTGVGMQVMPSVIYSQAQVAVKRLRQMMGGHAFDNPKDHEVLARLIRYCTSDGDIVLDSFAGSGTTAHAVLQVNNEDGKNRKFILIESEDYAEFVTAARVKRVIQGLAATSKQSRMSGLGGSFSFFKLGQPIELNTVLSGEQLPSYEELARYVFYTATGQPFDSAQLGSAPYYIGNTKQHDLYLLYQPDLQWLKTTGLTLEIAQQLSVHSSRHCLVFAPMNFLNESQLHHYKITVCQLPFELYQFRG
ncbi:site-specific DNA-methyltransferase [Oculatella sp. LEGE 06141]|uniref:site-specific DNA-methyltransferase n=1 Tax=Oculatella sp. LEGE 06141 TaxID=1828648 RepID=UPI001881B394|nr:site-specific DNA-methyltransferase [Oculatella sp. LEGE 06141]MBE9181729.1 site-specific DNA-methyltransferase [Oculatella sp. LEGE 06141]